MAAFVHIHIPSEASFPFYAHGHCVLQLTISTSQAVDSLFKADTKNFCYKELLLQVHFFLNTWHRGGLVWLTCHQYGTQDHAQTANQISSY